MKERIRDDGREGSVAVIELLTLTKTAAQKFKSACAKAKLL